MTPLSVFITTYNNARTLDACLQSVCWADEIVVLDSFSTDNTLEIAQRYGARIRQQAFLGYGPQKQAALELTQHEWVLLLDADEALSLAAATEIQALLQRGPSADGYTLARQEQLFWRMYHPKVRMNHFLRLFRRSCGHISDMPIHAAPEVRGRIERLQQPFYHYGETDIHTKVEKINAYSTGLVSDKIAKGRRAHPLIMLVYPPLFFLRQYLFKRQFLNGWAGLINSVVGAFYVFLKYAKLYEHQQFERHGRRYFPDNAPELPPRAPLTAKPADTDAESTAPR